MLLHGHLCHILQPMQECVARHGDTPSGKCVQRLLHGHPRQNKSIQRRKFIVWIHTNPVPTSGCLHPLYDFPYATSYMSDPLPDTNRQNNLFCIRKMICLSSSSPLRMHLQQSQIGVQFIHCAIGFKPYMRFRHPSTPTNDVVPLSPVLVYIMLFFMVPVIKNLQYDAYVAL